MGGMGRFTEFDGLSLSGASIAPKEQHPADRFRAENIELPKKAGYSSRAVPK